MQVARRRGEAFAERVHEEIERDLLKEQLRHGVEEKSQDPFRHDSVTKTL